MVVNYFILTSTNAYANSETVYTVSVVENGVGEISPFATTHSRDIKIIGKDGKEYTLDGSGTAVGLLDDGIDVRGADSSYSQV